MASKEIITRKTTKTIEVEEKVTALVLTEREAGVLEALFGMNNTLSRVVFEGDSYLGLNVKKRGVDQHQLSEVFADIYHALRK